MDYQKEYAILVGQVDRAISLLELFPPQDDLLVRRAGAILLNALQAAEEHYMAAAEQLEALQAEEVLSAQKAAGGDPAAARLPA